MLAMPCGTIENNCEYLSENGIVIPRVNIAAPKFQCKSFNAYDEAMDVVGEEKIQTPRSTSPSVEEIVRSLTNDAKLKRKNFKIPIADYVSKPCSYPLEKRFDEVVLVEDKIRKIKSFRLPVNDQLEPNNIASKRLLGDIPKTKLFSKQMQFSTSSGSYIGDVDSNSFHGKNALLPPKLLNVDKKTIDCKRTTLSNDTEMKALEEELEKVVQSSLQFQNSVPEKKSTDEKPVVKEALVKKKNRKNRVKKKPSVQVEVQQNDDSTVSVDKDEIDCNSLVEKHGWDIESAALAISLEKESLPENRTTAIPYSIEHDESSSDESNFKVVLSKRERRRLKLNDKVNKPAMNGDCSVIHKIKKEMTVNQSLKVSRPQQRSIQSQSSYTPVSPSEKSNFSSSSSIYGKTTNKVTVKPNPWQKPFTDLMNQKEIDISAYITKNQEETLIQFLLAAWKRFELNI